MVAPLVRRHRTDDGFDARELLLIHLAGSLLLAVMVAGTGLLGASVGFMALLWLGLEGLVRLLGAYVRLHYRALKPVSP